jgi:hypothetical protein
MIRDIMEKETPVEPAFAGTLRLTDEGVAISATSAQTRFARALARWRQISPLMAFELWRPGFRLPRLFTPRPGTPGTRSRGNSPEPGAGEAASWRASAPITPERPVA